MNTPRLFTSEMLLSLENILKMLAIAIVVLVIGYAIGQSQWKYLVVLLLPLLVYISLKYPFIFPLGAYAFFIPFDSVSSVTGGSGKIVTLAKLLGILGILVLTLKGTFESKFKKPEVVSLWWILFVFYGILSMVWADRIDIVLHKVSTVGGLLLLYLVITSYEVDRRDYRQFQWAILLGGLCASLLAIHGFMDGLKEFGRATLMFGGMVMNPNQLAFSLLLPFAVGIQMYLDCNSRKMKVLFLIFCALLVLGIIFSGSRANMLAAAVIILVYAYSSQRKIGLSFGLAMIGIALAQFIPEMFYARWDKAVSTGGSGRLDIWYAAWKAMEKYWLTGVGLGNFPVVYTQFASYAPKFQGVHRDAHNIYLAVAVELGVIGVILLVVALWSHYRLLKKSCPKGNSGLVMLKASFWAVLLSSCFNQRLWDKGFWLLWIMIVVYSNIMRSERSPDWTSGRPKL